MKKMKTCMLILCFILSFNHAPFFAEERLPGTYPVEVEYVDEKTGETKQKIVYMTVTHPTTTTDSENQEAIDAKDAVVSREIIEKENMKSIVKATGARAWSTIDGRSIPITKLQLIGCTKEATECSAVFYTEKGTNARVLLTIGEVFSVPSELDMIVKTPISLKKNLFKIIGLFIIIPLILLLIMYVSSMKKVKKMRQILYEEMQ